jgi:hypothetical protein
MASNESIRPACLLADNAFAARMDELKTAVFIHFELSFEPEQGPIWLSMRGGDGVKAFIQTETQHLFPQP